MRITTGRHLCGQLINRRGVKWFSVNGAESLDSLNKLLRFALEGKLSVVNMPYETTSPTILPA